MIYDIYLVSTKKAKLHERNERRLAHLRRIKPKYYQKWQCALNEYEKKSKLYITKQNTNLNISRQISLTKLLQIADFYKMKVLPIMHMKGREDEQRKLSMIQNIAIPSIFKIKHIRTFYNDPQNESFRFPLPSITDNYNNNNDIDHHHIASLKSYRSNQYQIALKDNNNNNKRSRHVRNKDSSSPLQKYMPGFTSISQMGIPFLTPPSHSKRRPILKEETKSLPKN